MTGITLRTHAPALLGRNAIDQLFDAFFNNPMPQIEKTTQGYPLTDIYKDVDGNQVIEMALAGFNKSDIQITCGPNKSMIIGCEKPNDKEANSSNRRIARRSFKKTFFDYHNQLDFNKSQATFENGLLRVTIPLIEEKEYKIIDIE
jgi:HSP20 family molecular chaperone IbpA